MNCCMQEKVHQSVTLTVSLTQTDQFTQLQLAPEKGQSLFAENFYRTCAHTSYTRSSRVYTGFYTALHKEVLYVKTKQNVLSTGWETAI